MITVKLKGGLGNQLFQYAFGRYLAIKNGVDLWLDVEELENPKPGDVKRELCLHLFNTQFAVAAYRPGCGGPGTWGRIKRWLDRGYYIRRDEPHSFNESLLNLTGDKYLDGYWQSYKFFQGIEDTIRREFSLSDNKVPACVLAMQNRIWASNSVCLNVRRGDFVCSAYHLCYGMDYFKAAMWEIKVRVNDPHFYIFSDDLAWCRDAFVGYVNTTIVDHTLAGPRFEYYLELMRSCRHFIIPNSTFGWWCSYLSENRNKIIIAPRMWYHGDRNRDIARNLCPADWILL